MAIVQGTGLAEEVYYGVDLAFRHLLAEPEAAVASTKVEMHDEFDSHPEGEPSFGFPIHKAILKQQHESKPPTIDTRSLMLFTIGVAVSCGFSIKGTSVTVPGPWKAHHGFRVGVDSSGSIAAYVVVDSSGGIGNSVQNLVIVKGTASDPDSTDFESIVFSVATLDEYTKSAQFYPTDSEKERLGQAIKMATRVGPVRFWYPNRRRG